MAWGRMDDGFHDHPKVEALSLDAVGLWSLCWSYANRHRKTSPVLGFISEGRARGEAMKRGVSPRRFDVLVRMLTAPLPGGKYGMWEAVEGGWLIHDYEDYLPKQRDPEELAESARRGGKARAAKQTASKLLGNSQATSQVNSQASSQATSKPTASKEPEDGLAKPASRRRARAFPSRPVTTAVTTEGGDRNETLRAATATDPPKCSRHPDGNPTDEPCAGCAKVREHADHLEAEARDARIRAIESCPDCGGTSWIVDPADGSSRKCDHRRTA